MKWKKWNILALLAAGLVLVQHSCAIAQERAAIEEKMEAARGYLEKEKQWIRENQGQHGEIYLNGTEAGDVNPYFACQAAEGLLAGEVTEEDFDRVAAYLSWHSQKLAERKGIICHYRRQADGSLQPNDVYDSVDSYIAVYISLLSDYAEKGGSLLKIHRWTEAADVSIDMLEQLVKDGLTSVSLENPTRYLMDNAEVYEACSKLDALLQSPQLNEITWEGKKKAAQFSSQMKEMQKNAIESFLWNPTETRYEVGLKENGIPVGFAGWDRFYPECAAQIYPVVCGVLSPSEERAELLYNSLNHHIEWEDGIGTEEFEWPVLAFAAIKMKDFYRGEQYLEYYQERYAEYRKYPFHTANSGWAARAYGELVTFYESRLGREQ